MDAFAEGLLPRIGAPRVRDCGHKVSMIFGKRNADWAWDDGSPFDFEHSSEAFTVRLSLWVTIQAWPVSHAVMQTRRLIAAITAATAPEGAFPHTKCTVLFTSHRFRTHTVTSQSLEQHFHTMSG